MTPLLRFGCWRGRHIGDIPIGYVLWLLGQCWFSARWPELYPAARHRAMKHFAAEIAEERCKLHSNSSFVDDLV